MMTEERRMKLEEHRFSGQAGAGSDCPSNPLAPFIKGESEGDF